MYTMPPTRRLCPACAPQWPPRHRFLLLLLCALLLTLARADPSPAVFDDVSLAAGLLRPHGPRIKYGGAAIADLDGDGCDDLLLGHHDHRWLDVYFSTCNATYTRANFNLWRDTHALTPFRFSAKSRRMHFVLSQGGNNGNMPNAPAVFEVAPDRAINDVSAAVGAMAAAQRGRSAIFMSLRRWRVRHTDAVFTGAFIKALPNLHHRVFQTTAAHTLRERPVPAALAALRNSYGTVTDVDGDGRVELVTFHKLTVHRVAHVAYGLEDISAAVLPRGMDREAVAAVAELDFDNDGKWDLYVARSSKGDLSWIRPDSTRDYLLRNVGGSYVDVSEEAGLRDAGAGETRGVTAGDFNNDGFTDLLLCRYDAPNLLLLNRGNGTFAAQDAGMARAESVAGDMATAYDYDRDGRLDVLLSEGDWFNKSLAGYYRLLRNVAPMAGNFLRVRVGAAAGYRAMSLHAVVTVTVGGGGAGVVKMRRRVGSPGTAVSVSYIETLHFGIGRRGRVRSVVVRWTDRSKQTMYMVAANSSLTFGLV